MKIVNSDYRNSQKGNVDLSKLIHMCVDIDECEDGSHNCHKHANCINTSGGYNCNCKLNYTGNGYTGCQRLNPYARR